MSRSNETLDAFREVWMQGYNHARREMGLPPLVQIAPADLADTFECGSCGNLDCPACGRHVRREKAAS